jgi:hypothetical protein
MDEVEHFFCQFPNPWTLRVSGMGCYTSKCEKKSKSLHPNEQLISVAGWSKMDFSERDNKQSVGARNRLRIGLSYRPARLVHSLAELVPWNQFSGSLKG